MEQSILPLISFNDALLRKPSEKFDFNNPPTDPIALSRQLADAMISHKGYGLSACQVGIPYSVFVMGHAGAEVYACFNPRIVMQSLERVWMKEGCLSFPGVVLDIERPTVCKVRYTQPNGQTVTKEFTGMTARVVQHEFDHLQGKLFTEHVSRLKLDIAKRKANKALGKRYYPV